MSLFRRNKPQQPNFEGIGSIRIVRFTKDAWDQCYPDNRNAYESLQFPDNLLDYYCQALTLMPNKETLNPSICFQQRLIGKDYLEWLGDRENTDEERTAYAGMEEAGSYEKMAKEGLNKSLWVYGFPVVGMNRNKTFSATIPYETTEALQSYFEKVINNPDFSVYIAPWIMQAEPFGQEAQSLKSMERIWFAQKKRVIYGKLDEISLPDENLFFLGFIPVIVREMHKDCSIPVRDLLEYMGELKEDGKVLVSEEHIGRNMGMVPFDENIKKVLPDAPSIWETEAGRLLRNDLSKIFIAADEQDTSTIPFFVPVHEIPNFLQKFRATAKKSMRKAKVGDWEERIQA